MLTIFLFTTYGFILSDLDNSGVRAVLTLGIMVIAAIISVILAKLFQYFRKNRIMFDDDKSDISEHTRDLIRTRLSIIRFRMNTRKASKQSKVLEFLRRWMATVQEKKLQREENTESDKVDAEVGTKNGCTKQNGVHNNESDSVVNGKSAQRISRLACFSRNNVAGDGSKPVEITATELTTVDTNQNSVPKRDMPLSNSCTPRAVPNYKVTFVAENGHTRTDNNGVNIHEVNGIDSSYVSETRTKQKRSKTGSNKQSSKPRTVPISDTIGNNSAVDKT